MAKPVSVEPDSFEDKVRFFTVGESFTGKRYVRHPDDGLQAAISHAFGLHCSDESLTQQHHRDDSDPNHIVAKFIRTGDPSLLTVKSPQFGDFSGVGDYQTALNAVLAADEAFGQLDAKIRARFNNDPQTLMEFMASEENYDEAVRLGLIEPARAEERRAASAPPKEQAKPPGAPPSAPPSNTSVRVSKAPKGAKPSASEEGEGE